MLAGLRELFLENTNISYIQLEDKTVGWEDDLQAQVMILNTKQSNDQGTHLLCSLYKPIKYA